MEKLIIEETDKMPRITFDPSSGKLDIWGRSIPEFPLDFYEMLYRWLDEYVKNPPPQTQLVVYLDYFNTTSSECLLDLFRKLELIQKNGGEVNVCWKYDEDDETMMDSGQIFKSMLQIPFNLLEIQAER